MDGLGGQGTSLVGVLIPILPEDLQTHLDALQSFCEDTDVTINVGKTKVMTHKHGSLNHMCSSCLEKRRWSMLDPMCTWGDFQRAEVF